MEEATGTQLAIVWDSLGPDVKLSVMREVVSIETKMMSLSFSQYAFSRSLSCANTYVLAVSYGSIYFASDAVEGAVPANIISETSAELKEKVSKAYTLDLPLIEASGTRSVRLWIFHGAPVCRAVHI